jgi:glutamyl-tRNA synthetase
MKEEMTNDAITKSETTRLAPSPTGALHLGNARTFLVNYLLAKQNGWRMLMRVEDLDGPRVKAQATADMLEELAWLGLEWDEPIVYQSQRADAYRSALERLIEGGWAYPCVCSRKDIEQAASAPHRGEGEVPYPGTCCNKYRARPAEIEGLTPNPSSDSESVPDSSRSLTPAGKSGTDSDSADRIGLSPSIFPTARHPAWRVRAPGIPVEVRDEFAGTHTFDLRTICGDFVIFKNDGTCAYQLAVVVDDAAAGVTAIVRGDDLLDSAARQIHLRRLLGLPENVWYWHLPLVVGPDGRRLAKRHGDTRISHYRQLGATRERILGLLAYWSGLLESRRETDLAELLKRFDIARVPGKQVIFSADDDLFLRSM